MKREKDEERRQPYHHIKTKKIDVYEVATTSQTMALLVKPRDLLFEREDMQ